VAFEFLRKQKLRLMYAVSGLTALF